MKKCNFLLHAVRHATLGSTIFTLYQNVIEILLSDVETIHG